MSFVDLVPDLRLVMPELRGRLHSNFLMRDVTWFRVGGPAQVLYAPADEQDLAYFLSLLPSEVPVTVVGLGSNLIVRDGGIAGVVIRAGRGFQQVEVREGCQILCGAMVPDVKLARAAAEAGIDGLAFYRGIPGSVGGALRMNAGAYGTETKDRLVEARGVDRQGHIRIFSLRDMEFSYRHCGVPEDVIFTSAVFQGQAGDPEAIAARMDEITASRDATQPVKSRTGGSTFKNPPGQKAWQLIDAAGCRGLRRGEAQVSELHCNFLLNLGGASATDIEELGEEVRQRVFDHCGVRLEWEIKRVGEGAASSSSG